jgi:hypothetical protein
MMHYFWKDFRLEILELYIFASLGMTSQCANVNNYLM